MIYYGTIRDAGTELPIPRATVVFFDDTRTLKTIAANDQGYFETDVQGSPKNITVSSVGYKPFTTPASTYQHIWDLERDPITLPPVFIPAQTRGGNWGIYIALAMAIFLIAKNK